MILTKTPLRISFVGGGSDRPSFYTEEPGACVAAAIDKYVYVAVNEKYDGRFRVAYSQTDDVDTVEQVQHELAREALNWFKLRGGVEIHSIADVPGSTGLGSSSAFTVGAIAAMAAHVGQPMTSKARAIAACMVEIDRCRKPIGKQDQYTAAYGGVNLLGFTTQGVTVAPIACDLTALSAHCLLLDTGLTRTGDAGAVLAGQHRAHDDVRQLAQLARAFALALGNDDFPSCGAMMDDAWEIKGKYCSTVGIDRQYRAAQRFGAWGGKLCGAGGGGFLLFLAPPETHAGIIAALGLRHVPIRVGVEGCHVVYASGGGGL